MSTFLRSFLASVPALDDSNPGRDGWTIADEVEALADAGSNGLAGAILAHGFAPGKPATVASNVNGITLAPLAAGILAGLDARKAKDGSVRKLSLATDKDGKAVSVDIDSIRAILADIDPQEVAPEYAIPAGGDGRRRTVAYALAALYAAALSREVGPMATLPVATDKGVDALAGNLLDAYRSALGPWQKVAGAVNLMRERPTVGESEIMAITGAKRGDGQLMHRAASAIIRHRLAVDMTRRCPGKEEWPAIRDAATAEEAAALLSKAYDAVRPKAVGIDVWQRALANVPEGATLDARAVAKAMEAGTEEALAALVQPLLAK